MRVKCHILADGSGFNAKAYIESPGANRTDGSLPQITSFSFIDSNLSWFSRALVPVCGLFKSLVNHLALPPLIFLDYQQKDVLGGALCIQSSAKPIALEASHLARVIWISVPQSDCHMLS